MNPDKQNKISPNNISSLPDTQKTDTQQTGVINTLQKLITGVALLGSNVLDPQKLFSEPVKPAQKHSPSQKLSAYWQAPASSENPEPESLMSAPFQAEAENKPDALIVDEVLYAQRAYQLEWARSAGLSETEDTELLPEDFQAVLASRVEEHTESITATSAETIEKLSQDEEHPAQETLDILFMDNSRS
ncbi:MAG: hypothetical protein K2X01_00050 [Cyanobacteria bacterium]|nr:hypothetical protein [Cyanobacteriota bacterium]